MSGNKRLVVDWEAIRRGGATIVQNAERVEVDPEAVRGNTVNPQSLIEYMRQHGYLTRP